MNEYLAETVRQRMERTADALKKNRMDAYLVKSRSEVVPLIRTLLHPNDTVAVGGSVSLDECGVLDLLRCGDYQFLDRYASGLSGEQIAEIYRKSFFADAFLCSTNAVTESGELYNVDGKRQPSRRDDLWAGECYSCRRRQQDRAGSRGGRTAGKRVCRAGELQASGLQDPLCRDRQMRRLQRRRADLLHCGSSPSTANPRPNQGHTGRGITWLLIVSNLLQRK